MLLEIFTGPDLFSEVSEAVADEEFCARFLKEVVTKVFGVEDPQNRPAEYAVVPPIDLAANPNNRNAVILRLSGVSTHGRPLKMFHNAAKALHRVCRQRIAQVLKNIDTSEKNDVHLFCYLELDNVVETWPGSGKYGNLVEHPAEWITYASALKEDDDEPSLG